MLFVLATTLVVCAPGYAGNTAEAQPAMDALARSVAAAARLPQGSLSAVYEETSKGGLRRLAHRDAALLLAPLPFYLEQERELRLVPRMMAAPQGGAPLEQWTLVAGKAQATALASSTVQSIAGYSKRFVHAAAPSLPAGVTIVASSAVLSGLRRAADGEKIALLLDGAQSAALEKLPFASSLVTLERSRPMPVAVLATIGNRIDEARWRTLQRAFSDLAAEPEAAATLQTIRMSAFVPLDENALDGARAAWQRAR